MEACSDPHHRHLRAARQPAAHRRTARAPGRHGERRVVPLHKVEVRANDDGTWTSAATPPSSTDLSENLGGFREIIKRGAFKKVLKTTPTSGSCRTTTPNLVLARTHAGTLALKEDAEGPGLRRRRAPTSYADDLRVLLDRGDMTQSSFAFRVAPGGQNGSRTRRPAA
jgi:HK97 family phage prohead protease